MCKGESVLDSDCTQFDEKPNVPQFQSVWPQTVAMADPLSIAAVIAGFLTLRIQVTQGLVHFIPPTKMIVVVTSSRIKSKETLSHAAEKESLNSTIGAINNYG
jgi:CBS domain containing-hemolysin-like protein